MTFAVGQRWTYRTPQGLEASRIVIGAILTFDGGMRIVCCSVLGAGRLGANGALEVVNIPFLPMTESALAATVLELDGGDEPVASFGAKLAEWSDDPRGMSTFTVPFEGFLDQMIANQMAAIAGRSAA